jgi:hypothetical protein
MCVCIFIKISVCAHKVCKYDNRYTVFIIAVSPLCMSQRIVTALYIKVICHCILHGCEIKFPASYETIVDVMRDFEHISWHLMYYSKTTVISIYKLHYLLSILEQYINVSLFNYVSVAGNLQCVPKYCNSYASLRIYGIPGKKAQTNCRIYNNIHLIETVS